MKKTLLLLAALLLICIPISAFAEEDAPVSITVLTADAAQDTQVDITIDLDACIGVDSVQFNLNYDPAALTVVKVEPGQLIPAEYCVYNKDEAGRVRVACACAEGMTQAGTLITIRFKTVMRTGSALTLTDGIVTRVDAENDYAQTQAYVALTNGGITIDGGAIPSAQVTPWIPATPPPTPTPTPEPTEPPQIDAVQITPEATPFETPEPETQAMGEVGAVSYVVVAVLLALLIALIVIMAKRSHRGAKSEASKKAR